MKTRKTAYKIALLLATFGVGISNLSGSPLSQDDNVKPSLERGAKVFVERCALCHGSEGRGDGVIPRKIKSYPSTNLHNAKYSQSRESVLKISIYGGSTGEMSNFMPPMGNDLTWTQLHSVVDFIMLLRKDAKSAKLVMDKLENSDQVSTRIGQDIFKNRCALCHGNFGEGDGRMAKVIKNPPPFDLTASRMPQPYLHSIISVGGEAMGRSVQMPPWKDELSTSEIDSVIQYIISIRD